MDLFSERLDEHGKRRIALFKYQKPDEADYGYSLTNPIMTSTVFRSDEYLGRLRTEDGMSFTWDRTRSFNLDLGDIKSVMVDEYDLYLNGEKYTTLYICPYGHSSDYVPKGLKLAEKHIEPSSANTREKIKQSEAEKQPNKSSPDDSNSIQDEKIKALNDLLAADVISKEEYDAKVKLILQPEAAITEAPIIDPEELNKLNTLLDQGIIDDNEYDTLKRRLSNPDDKGVVKTPEIKIPSTAPKTKKKSGKILLAVLATAVVVIILAAVMYNPFGKDQPTGTDTSAETEDAQTADGLTSLMLSGNWVSASNDEYYFANDGEIACPSTAFTGYWEIVDAENYIVSITYDISDEMYEAMQEAAKDDGMDPAQWSRDEYFETCKENDATFERMPAAGKYKFIPESNRLVDYKKQVGFTKQ